MQKIRILKQKILKFVSGHKLSIIILATLLLLFIVPPFINWVVSTDLGLGIGFITPENKNTWIGFYGAIIGGGITLGGVAWTIYDQNKKRRVDLSMQYKPILFLSNDFITRAENRIPENRIYQCNENITYYLKLKNLGRGEATNVKLDLEFKEKLFDVKFKKDSMQSFDFIVPSDTGISIILILTIKEKGIDYLGFTEKNNPKIKIKIEYHSLFKKKSNIVCCDLEHVYQKGEKNEMVLKNNIVQ